ncbi:peptide/nickel transport system substrate-binding protein [Oceanotoga teriensis]|uniref:Peptide/nickel transport system substrate-binding protein n=1 Tax=Oceanotoga teriensis TaxID=515440 RepID=A0AA45C8G6_9BACT|nr:ABC transporter substrate-binding protein [Oceanotoga teriensis]PWJ96143.1 peptide/nickel transport system substrate-binding protein [Oceanotoga teriensis]
MRKTFLVFLMLTALVLSFAAVKNPNVIVKSVIGEPETLDPAYAYDNASGEVINNISENLIAYDGEHLTKFIPMLSTVVPSVENGLMSEDGLTYSFKIRKGVKFHNGETLTPEDVEYSFERNLLASQFGGPMWMLLEPLTGVQYLEDLVPSYVGAADWADIFDENNEPKAMYKDKLIKFYEEVIDPVVEVNGDMITFKLAMPYGPFLNVLAQNSNWSTITNAKWAKEQGAWDGKADGWWKWHNLRTEDATFYANYMGTGPFKLVEWDRTQRKVVLERFNDYWREPAKVEKVIIQVMEEWSTSKAALEAGDVDILTPDQQYMSQLRGREKEGITTVEGLTTISSDVIGVLWTINPDSKYIGSGKLDGQGIPINFFAEPNVRKGFQASFDYLNFIKMTLEGQGLQIPSALPKGLLGYSENSDKPEFNLDKATSYFKRAYRGQLWNRGFKMTLTYNSGNDTRKTAMEILRDNLAKINPKFQVEVRAVQWADYVAQRRSKTAPINFFSWQADYPDPHNFIATYYNSDAGYYGAFMGEDYAKFAKTPQAAFGGISLNDYIDMALKEANTEKRQAMYEKITDFVVDNAINIPTYQVYSRKAMRTWLKGWSRNPMQGNNEYFYPMYKAE